MAPPVTEIVRMNLKAGTTFEDPSSPEGQVWQDIVATIQRQDGYQRLYVGRQVENANEAVMLIDWDSLAAHQKFMGLPEYGPFVKTLVSVLDGPPTVYHAELSPFPPTRAVSNTQSPVTELVTFYFDPSFSDADAEKFETGMAEFVNVVDENARPGFKASSIGRVVETELEIPNKEGAKGRAFQIAFGWESVEAHMKFRETKAFKDNIEKAKGGVVGAWACHVSFNEY